MPVTSFLIVPAHPFTSANNKSRTTLRDATMAIPAPKHAVTFVTTLWGFIPFQNAHYQILFL